VKMHVGVNHHQHEIIDALVTNPSGQRLLNRSDGIGLLLECFSR